MDDDIIINPATGLLMIGGIGGLDVGGNIFGTGLIDTFTDTSISIIEDPVKIFGDD